MLIIFNLDFILNLIDNPSRHACNLWKYRQNMKEIYIKHENRNLID